MPGRSRTRRNRTQRNRTQRNRSRRNRSRRNLHKTMRRKKNIKTNKRIVKTKRIKGGSSQLNYWDQAYNDFFDNINN